MIYINFVELYSQMLLTKFQNHRPSGSEEEDHDHLYKLSFSLPKELHKKFGFDWPSGFREEDVSMLWSYTCI